MVETLPTPALLLVTDCNINGALFARMWCSTNKKDHGSLPQGIYSLKSTTEKRHRRWRPDKGRKGIKFNYIGSIAGGTQRERMDWLDYLFNLVNKFSQFI